MPKSGNKRGKGLSTSKDGTRNKKLANKNNQADD